MALITGENQVNNKKALPKLYIPKHSSIKIFSLWNWVEIFDSYFMKYEMIKKNKDKNSCLSITFDQIMKFT